MLEVLTKVWEDGFSSCSLPRGRSLTIGKCECKGSQILEDLGVLLPLHVAAGGIELGVERGLHAIEKEYELRWRGVGVTEIIACQFLVWVLYLRSCQDLVEQFFVLFFESLWIFFAGHELNIIIEQAPD